MAHVNQATLAFTQIITDGFHRYYQAFQQWTNGAKKHKAVLDMVLGTVMKKETSNTTMLN